MFVRFLSRPPKKPAAARLGVERLEDRCLLSGDIVIEWTDLLLKTGQPRGQNNAVASRVMAILEAAIYDSVNATDPAYTVYHVDATAFPGAATASAEAAAAQAAHDVAVGLYKQLYGQNGTPPEVAQFDSTLAADLAAIPDGQAETDGIALGQYVAGQILDWRANDGSSKVVPYQIGTNPGDWQPTPPAFNKTPVNTQWPYVTPFALTSGSQFRPGPPPDLTSADYTEAFQQVKALGGDGVTTPSARTPEQTEIAKFWGIAPTNGGVAIWNQIAKTVAAAHGNTLAQNARLFALLNVTLADSFIAGADAKYAYNFWRPVTAIRAADTDGNPDTSADPTWTPLIMTPNHPSYVAFHASQSESAAQALASFFGDHVDFTVTSPGLPGVERSFTKFTAAAHEAGLSRIYGGIHWSFDVAAGWHLGRNVGQYVAANFFLPVQAGGNEHGSDDAEEASRKAGGEQQEVGRKAGGVQTEAARKAGKDQQDLAGLGDAFGASRILVMTPREEATPRKPSSGSGTAAAGEKGEPASFALPPVLPSGGGDTGFSAVAAEMSAARSSDAADPLFAELGSGLRDDGTATVLAGAG
jgi:PAP2 superfamily